MRIFVVFLIINLGTSILAAHDALTGYKANVYTRIYEDGSVYREIELNMDPDAHETIQHKKQFFTRNGYRLSERNENQEVVLLASKTFGPSAEAVKALDDFSEMKITFRRDSVYFSESFFTRIVSEEVQSSDLNSDLSAAKVMMSDTEFFFRTVFPGRITEPGSGKFNGDTLTWQFDVEQVFQKPVLQMAGTSVIQRGEELLWITGLAGFLVFLIAGLLYVRRRCRLRPE